MRALAFAFRFDPRLAVVCFDDFARDIQAKSGTVGVQLGNAFRASKQKLPGVGNDRMSKKMKFDFHKEIEKENMVIRFYS